MHTEITTINAMEDGSVVKGMKGETLWGIYTWVGSRLRVNCRTERGK